MDGHVLTLKNAPVSWRNNTEVASSDPYRSPEKQPELKMLSDIQEALVEHENVPESYQEIFEEGNLLKDTSSYKPSKRKMQTIFIWVLKRGVTQKTAEFRNIKLLKGPCISKMIHKV